MKESSRDERDNLEQCNYHSENICVACSSEDGKQSVLMEESNRDEGDDLGHGNYHSKYISR